MTKNTITQSQLKEHFNYSPETGLFTWIKISGYRAKVGDIAGNNHCRGYKELGFMGKSYLVHRLVWLYMMGEWPKDMIDHINGDRSDNRFCNLREATNAQNLLNKGKSPKNTSGLKGVHWNKPNKKWIAQCTINGTKKYIGSFLTKEDAYEAYKKFAKNNHGEFYFDNSLNLK